MLEILLYLLDIVLLLLTLMPILLMMELLLCSLDIALPLLPLVPKPEIFRRLPLRVNEFDIMVNRVTKSLSGVS